MKLTHARVQNFRSILDTGKFSINDLCCLVGKNEAGKTATLTAVQSILPYGDPQTYFDVTEDYPRRFATRYHERHKNSEAVVVETWWQLCDEGYERLCEEFSEDAVRSREFRIYKKYNTENTIWDFDLDEAVVVASILKAHRLNATEQASLSKCSTILQVLEKIETREEPTEKLRAIAKHFENYQRSIQYKATELVGDLVPTFFYTSHYDRMSGKLSIQKIADRKLQRTKKMIMLIQKMKYSWIFCVLPELRWRN